MLRSLPSIQRSALIRKYSMLIDVRICGPEVSCIANSKAPPATIGYDHGYFNRPDASQGS